MIPSKKEKIAIEVIKTLITRFETFPIDASNNRNAPFHEAFLNAFADKLEGKVPDIPFFISLSSWLHGLNTTLGQSFFENVSHILSGGEKKEFTSNRGTLLRVSQEQKNAIANIVTDLKNGVFAPDLNRENELIFLTSTSTNLDANSFTADVFIEEEAKIIAIELKTVKPNAGEMRGEKQKILEAKAALFNRFRSKEIEYYIGFPFDPTSDTPTGSDKCRFLRSIIDGDKYFALDEVLLASELWDFLSGDKNTMEYILDILNKIATKGFMEKFKYLGDNTNRKNNTKIYKTLLNDWFLFSEIELLNNDSEITKNLYKETRARRIYNQSIFKNGDYNFERYNFLVGLIK
ncbi:MAG: restriction endonuclease [Candidatus Brocadia sp. UTAMX1]|jgi:hypothetical protein|nr:MAG: restriction endonuclease [Candidatus Brocadia sp. UTAMX1]